MKRYTIFKIIDVDKFYKSWPIEIQKIAITKDNREDKLLLQVKMCNITNKKIKAVYLTGETFDDSFDKIGEVECIYQDLDVNEEQTFGDEEPVVLNDKTIRNVELKINKIVYEDGSIFRGDLEEEPLLFPQDSNIEDEELFEEYKRINQNKSQYEVKNYPTQTEEYWKCCCGRVNHNDIDVCTRCERDRDYIYKSANHDFLVTSKNAYEEEVKIEEEKRLEQERIKKEEEKAAKEIKDKKNKKIFLIAAVVASIFLLGMIVSNFSNVNYKVTSKKQGKYNMYTMEVTSEISSKKDLEKLEKIVKTEVEKAREKNGSTFATFSINTPNFFTVSTIYGDRYRYNKGMAISEGTTTLNSSKKNTSYTKKDVQDMLRRINSSLKYEL